MSAQHTQDTLIVLPPSVGVDANWHVTDKGDTFVAHVFGFGHAVDKQSEINARRIAACWNFCEGIETERLEEALPLQDLAEHVALVVAQRDKLLELLNELRCNFTCDDDLPDNLLPRIDAAIAEVEGGAA